MIFRVAKAPLFFMETESRITTVRKIKISGFSDMHHEVVPSCRDKSRNIRPIPNGECSPDELPGVTTSLQWTPVRR